MCPACTDKAARQAAELHAAGGMTWNQVAAVVGYGTGEGARYAAKRIGYVPATPVPAVKPERLCQCGAKAGPRGRCQGCRATAAARAAELYASGWTMHAIATELGYHDASGVSKVLARASAGCTPTGT